MMTAAPHLNKMQRQCTGDEHQEPDLEESRLCQVFGLTNTQHKPSKAEKIMINNEIA
jgi:hypothetical protein